MFDLFRLPKRGKQHLAVLGYTVYQEEYDALKAECDRAHQLNAAQAHEIELLTEENGELWKKLREAQEEAAVWRSKYEDLQTEKRLDQLVEIDVSNVVRLEAELEEAKKVIEDWQFRAQHWKEQFDEANHLIEVLQAQVDTLNAKPAPRRKKVQDVS